MTPLQVKRPQICVYRDDFSAIYKTTTRKGFLVFKKLSRIHFSHVTTSFFLPLLAPPLAPTNINVTVVTESVVVVTWSPPSYDGGRTDLTYDIQCSTCSNVGFCSSNCAGVQFWPLSEDLSTTQVIISSLNPAALYNITVISKNGVSEHAEASSVGHSHTTFSLTTPTTRNPERSTTLATITTNGGIPSHDEITTVGGMEHIMIFTNCDPCYYYFKLTYMRDITFFCIFFH